MTENFEFSWQISSQVEQINRIVVEANQFFDQRNVTLLDRFCLNMLLWEAMSNAVVHGCQDLVTALVDCRLSYLTGPESSEVIIDVTDPGPGFNWRQVMSQKNSCLNQDPAIGEPLPECGRGLMIYRKYATSIEFNAKGNQVILRRDLEKGVVGHE
jgi:anti-sigma regulatory factor (Ser/Thr protein kinase)